MRAFVCAGSLLFFLGLEVLAVPAPEVKVTSSVLLQSVLQDLALPPLGAGEKGEGNKPWPAFNPAVIARYADRTPPDPKLKSALRKAQVAIWAVSTTPVPRELSAEVQKLRSTLGFAETGLKSFLQAPPPGPAENRFKALLVQEHRMLARAQGVLEEIQEELASLQDVRDRSSLRWQATFDVMTARLNAQQVALDEVQNAYGIMRKEFPPLGVGHRGWQLVTVEKIHGEMSSKKMAAQAHKGLTKVQHEHPGTVWAEMASRLKRVPLGLEWQSVP